LILGTAKASGRDGSEPLPNANVGYWNGLSRECGAPNHVGGLETEEKCYDNGPGAHALAGLWLLLFPIFGFHDCTPCEIQLTAPSWQVLTFMGVRKLTTRRSRGGAADRKFFDASTDWLDEGSNSFRNVRDTAPGLSCSKRLVSAFAMFEDGSLISRSFEQLLNCEDDVVGNPIGSVGIDVLPKGISVVTRDRPASAFQVSKGPPIARGMCTQVSQIALLTVHKQQDAASRS
jgi:hypothetical protein